MVTVPNDEFLQHHIHHSGAHTACTSADGKEVREDLEVFLLEVILKLKFEIH